MLRDKPHPLGAADAFDASDVPIGRSEAESRAGLFISCPIPFCGILNRRSPLGTARCASKPSSINAKSKSELAVNNYQPESKADPSMLAGHITLSALFF